MYFDPKPKENRKDFYNHVKEYSELRKAVEGEDYLIIIKGLRRTGKTSLMRVVYNEVKGEKIWIDARSVKDLNTALVERLFEKATEVDLLKKISSAIEGFDFYVRLKKEQREEYLDKLIKELENHMASKKKFLLIFVDEIQLFPSIGNIIAYLLDNSRRIKFVISGSEVGLVDRFLGEEYESPLFGRPHLIIELESLPKEKSRDFLIKGAKMAGFRLASEQVDEAVSKFNGTMGWLTLYGYYAKRDGHKKAISEVKTVGMKTVGHEVNRFLVNKGESAPNYLKLIKLLGSGEKRWSDIKLALNLDDKKISKYLKNVVNYGLVIKKDERYVIPDPLLLEYARNSD